MQVVQSVGDRVGVGSQRTDVLQLVHRPKLEMARDVTRGNVLVVKGDAADGRGVTLQRLYSPIRLVRPDSQILPITTIYR